LTGVTVTTTDASDPDPGAPPPAGELLEAVTELGEALRRALAASVSTAASPAELRQAARDVRRATELLTATPRPRSHLSPLDDMSRGIRVFNPVVGVGSGIAVPLAYERDGDGVLVRTELGQAYEGPPTYLHGGVAALLMDQVLGYGAIVAGRWGMTVDLRLRYRRPVPLHTPLRLTARVSETSGRRTTVLGGIAADDAPDTPLVEATGIFVSPSAEVADQYFGAVRNGAGEPVDGRLGTGPR
jgi:acyl-coenzyme A thioesterase PaaI-like protein